MSAGDLRFPSTQSALARIQSGGLKFETVIDVGVHEGTPKLMKALPNALHLLIEPSAAHANAIAKNYREIPHELIPVAAGKEDGSVWFVDHAIDGGTAITHSRIVSSREEAERTENLRNIAELPVRRLDTIAAERDLAGPIFLKIDVDGKEIDVLEGARGLLGDVSALSIEAPLMHLSERTLWLEEAGFTLYDIVDFDYYKNVLWQVDLVFVAESAIESHPDLVASPNVGPFKPAAYQSLAMHSWTSAKRRWWKRR